MIECSRCIYTDSPCVPSDYGRDEHNNCDHFKSVFEENKEIYKKMADLDTALEDCTESLTDARIKIKELEKENEELKDKLSNLASVAEVRLANWQKYEKENAELKKQIEKMKCCQNCKFEDNDCIEEPCSACTRCLGDIKRKGNSDKWEIKE